MYYARVEVQTLPEWVVSAFGPWCVWLLKWQGGGVGFAATDTLVRGVFGHWLCLGGRG